MKPLWKIRSGQFAGNRSGDRLYNASGRNIGFFRGDVAYSIHGHHIGEIYNGDYIGKRLGVGHASIGSSGQARSIGASSHGNRGGLGIGGWDDPDF